MKLLHACIAVFIIFIILLVPTGTIDDLFVGLIDASSVSRDGKILIFIIVAILIYMAGKKK